MKPERDPKVRRIVSCSGLSWYTSATSTADYLFDPAFMKYFILGVILYATLIGAHADTTVPLPARLVFWTGLVMTSLIWLYVSVGASVAAYDRGLTKAIYMPLILLPLILMNAFMEQFVLPVLNVDFRASHVVGLEYALRNIVILVVLEIIHARYVAPQHPKYVASGQTPEHTNMAPQTNAIPAIADAEGAMLPSAGMVETQGSVARVEEPATQPEAMVTKSPNKIMIARERLDAGDILWIKSEDHYLFVQMKDRNLMLRGKLRSAIEELGDQLGLQINRSVWVAYAAIREVDNPTNGKVELLLEDDTTYIVSKARLLMFKQNYERFRASVSGGAEINAQDK